MDWDEDSLSARDESTTPAQQVLKKVVIPTNSHSSIGSSLSSVRDQSSGYDTPATSAVATPMELPVKPSSFAMSTGRMGDLAKGKQKRSQVDELLEADALLAQSLQEQEYGEKPQSGIKSKRARKAPIEDSDDEVSLLSDVPVESSLDIDDSEVPKSRRPKVAPRTSLPSRTARDSAKKSMKGRASIQIIDSEDSGLSDYVSDGSVFLSDLNTEVFDDSEEGDEDADVVASTHDATGTITGSDPAAATPRRRQRRRAPVVRARSSWRSRQMQGMMDRVRQSFMPTSALWQIY